MDSGDDLRHESRRPIRSFVLRQGRLTQGQERALQESWPKWGLSLHDGQLNFAALFSNCNPVTLEIGFGMGDSLAEQAATNPGKNFVGVEVHQPGVGHLLMCAESQEITNIRIFSEDSVLVLDQAIPDHSLDRVQVFFPDPWPKKRHHKRRLVNAAFVRKITSKLVPGGCLHFATDWVPYAEEVEMLLADHPQFERCEPPGRPETKFERRGIKLGHEVRDLAWRLSVSLPASAGC